MRVAILSDYESEGGAAVSTTRLATALSAAGAQVTRIVAFPDGSRHPWATPTPPPQSIRRQILHRISPGPRRAALAASEARSFVTGCLADLRPDVVNVHNLHQAPAPWGLETVRLASRFAPVAWTLHDTWSFTGRCTYMYECDKFVFGCDAACPTPDEYPALAPEKIAPAWDERRRLLDQNSSISAVSPSKWLAAQARRGLWKNRRVDVIPYGLPMDVYQPKRRAIAREALGVPVEGPALLIAAHALHERRKGVAGAIAALAELKQPCTLLVIGEGAIDVPNPRVSVHHLGYIRDERLKVLAYNAADVLVHPALVDNLPNVVLEAMACGTPTVGFRIGGVPEMVRPGLTGWLAPETSLAGLKTAILDAIGSLSSSDGYREACREVATREFDMQLQAERYLGLFDSLSGRADSPAVTAGRA